MCTARPRRGSVLLLAAALLLVTLPAAAQPAARTAGAAGEATLAPTWLQAATSWLIGFLPDWIPGLAFTTNRGAGADPDGAASLKLQRVADTHTDAELTVEPERGPTADPDG